MPHPSPTPTALTGMGVFSHPHLEGETSMSKAPFDPDPRLVHHLVVYPHTLDDTTKMYDIDFAFDLKGSMVLYLQLHLIQTLSKLEPSQVNQLVDLLVYATCAKNGYLPTNKPLRFAIFERSMFPQVTGEARVTAVFSDKHT
jgi:hypothetical protein